MDNRRGERGQVLVMGALMMTAMLAFLALVVDIGYGMAQRRFMQNAADASSIAAARYLVASIDTGTSDGAVVGVLNRYLVSNGSASPIGGLTTARYLGPSGAPNGVSVGFGGTIPRVNPGSMPAYTGVEVTATKQFNTFFARVLGYDTMTVNAVGAANFGAVTSVPLDWTRTGVPVMPIVLDDQAYINGTTNCHGLQGFGPSHEFHFSLYVDTVSDCSLGIPDMHMSFSTLNVGNNCSDRTMKDFLDAIGGDPSSLGGSSITKGVTPLQVCHGVRNVNWDMIPLNKPVLVPTIAHAVAIDCDPKCDTPAVEFRWVEFKRVTGSGSSVAIDGYWVDPTTMDALPGTSITPITGAGVTGPLGFTLVR